MAAVFALSGRSRALQCLVNQAPPEDLVLCLFTNDQEPGPDDQAGQYVEPTGFGYAPITLSGQNWTILAGEPPVARYGWKSFILKGAVGRICGYFIRQGQSGALVCAERFSDGPYQIGELGGQVKVRPTISAPGAREFAS